MIKKAVTLLAFLTPSFCLCQEQRVIKDFYQRGIVQRNGNTIHMHGEDARPLWVATDALAREYGWLISYEEPMYDKSSESVRANNSVWDSRHPDKPSRIPSGTSFDSDFTESPQAERMPGRPARILAKLVDDYNRSPNPGRFVLRQQSSQRFVLVGESRKGGRNGVLDTVVLTSQGKQSGMAALTSMVSQINNLLSVRVELARIPWNLLFQENLTLDGSASSARNVLAQISDAAGTPLMWSLTWDEDDGHYMLNLLSAVKVKRDSLGNERYQLIKNYNQ